MKKSIIVLLIVAFTAGVGLVSPVETEATCLICCTSCYVLYLACMDTVTEDFEGYCRGYLDFCRDDCPCCGGCPGG